MIGRSTPSSFRRSVLKLILGWCAVPVVAPIGASAQTVPATGESKWRAAFANANNVLSIASALGGVGGGGGLSSLLKANFALSTAIFEQLQEVQTSIANLRAELALLSTEVQGMITRASAQEQLADLVSAAADYLALVRQDVTSGIDWKSSNSQWFLASYLNRLQQASGILSQAEFGHGPENVPVVGVALTAEIAILQRKKYAEGIPIALQRYKRWLEAITGSGPGAITTQIQLASKTHDLVLDIVSSDEWARALNVSSFKLDGPQEPELNAHHCFVIQPGITPRGWVNAKQARTVFGGPGHAVAHRGALLLSMLDKDLRTNLIEYRVYGPVVYGSQRAGNPPVRTYHGMAPPDEVRCIDIPTGQWWTTVPASQEDKFREEIWTYIDEHNLDAIHFIPRRANTLSAIERANIQRARIAHCLYAGTVAKKMLNEVNVMIALAAGSAPR